MKNKIYLSALLMLTSMVMTSCLFDDSNGKTIPFERLKKDIGYNASCEGSEEILITNNNQLYHEYNQAVNDSSALPIVDFNSNMVIMIHLRCRPSSGYSTEIEEIILIDNTILVKYNETRPDGFADDVITSPYDIVYFRKSNNKIEFQKTIN